MSISIHQSSLSKVCKPALLDGLRCSSERKMITRFCHFPTKAKLKISEQDTSKLKTKHVKNMSKNYRFIVIQYFLFKDKESITNFNLFTQRTSLKVYRSRHVDFKNRLAKLNKSKILFHVLGLETCIIVCRKHEIEA